MNEPSALKPGQPVGEVLRGIAVAILARAQAVLDDSGRDATKTVHEIRRVMKRWRALLRMMTLLVGDEARTLRHQARDLARKLSVARDAQAAIDAFRDAVEKDSGDDDGAVSDEGLPVLSARSQATVHARLEGLRTQGERSIWNEERREELLDYIVHARAQVDGWALEKIDFADVADALTVTYRRARAAIPDKWDEIGDEKLHELRRRVVEHRYQMELIEPVWPRLGRIWVEEAQRLRSRLGKFQDLVVLVEKTGPHQPLAPWRSRLGPLIARRKRDHTNAARKVAARLFAEPPKAFRRRVEALWEAQDEA